MTPIASSPLLKRLLLALPGACVLSAVHDSDQSMACLLRVPEGCYQALQHADGRVELWSVEGELEAAVGPGLTRQSWMARLEDALNQQKSEKL